MTHDNRFHHHPYLSRVAAEDVRFVLEKDTSYGASWKKSGGRSAWHMLRRKMDRLITMMEVPAPPPRFNAQRVKDMLVALSNGNPYPPPPTSEVLGYLWRSHLAEDVFGMIEAAPSGTDGTALAEVRDLRRYLLLVEAEMIARGVVEAPPSTVTIVHEMSAGGDLNAEAEALLNRLGQATGASVLREGPVPSPPVEIGQMLPPRPPQAWVRPEDGVADGSDHGGITWATIWSQDPLTKAVYLNVDRIREPNGKWDHLQRLPVEANHKEWIDLLPEYRGMYTLSNSKYRLDRAYLEHWGLEP